MSRIKICYFASVVLLFILILGINVAVVFNTDFGNLDVKITSVLNGDQQINGLLYRPRDTTNAKPSPGVVLIHGISSAKQTMSGIALELARCGFVALAIDAVGHGSSGGQLVGTKDPTLGTLAAVHYLESQSFVKASSIGLVGHSLGAGAVRAATVAHGNIAASVFIGGGIGAMVDGTAYGVLNSTFPKNLLIAVGKYDVLFNLTQLRTEALLPIFGTAQEIVPDHLYGDFTGQTARKLITPATTHLFEPFDPTVISETVLWMTNALQIGGLNQNGLSEKSLSLTYIYREAAITVSLIAFIGIIFPSSLIVSDLLPLMPQKEKSKTKFGVLEDWKTLIIWGGLGVLLYFPMSFVGFLISFPPLIFGASIAWWILTVAIVGLIILFLAQKFSTIKLKLTQAISESFDRQGIMTAVILFALAYLVASVTEIISAIDLGIIVPFFRALNPPSRILMFAMFIPFFLVYFFVEGLYLHEFHKWPMQRSGFRPEAAAIIKIISIKVSPYVAVLLLQYAPLVLLNVQLFPSFAGFLIEFFWLIVPVFMISTACSWWFYRSTSAIGLGVIFNSLLFAWISAALFPF